MRSMTFNEALNSMLSVGPACSGQLVDPRNHLRPCIAWQDCSQEALSCVGYASTINSNETWGCSSITPRSQTVHLGLNHSACLQTHRGSDILSKSIITNLHSLRVAVVGISVLHLAPTLLDTVKRFSMQDLSGKGRYRADSLA